jgi:VCBS repeat protein/HYDIN/CFA65/VesB family protein
MNRHTSMIRNLAVLILAVTTFVWLTPASQAQVYLFGRADFAATGNPTNVVIADFNGDGRPDMAVTDSQNNWVSILLGSAKGAFVAAGTYATGTGPVALSAADFNGDKKMDLAVVNANAGTISILLGNGDGTFQSHTDYPVGQNPSGIVAADFNSDGKVDLATLSTNDSAITIMLGSGDGSFDVQALIPVPGPTFLASGDVNGDGKIDLITCTPNSNNGTITVLLSKGDGTFKQVQSPALTYDLALAMGDFNRDGKLDAIIQVGYGLYLLLGNGDGSFQSPVAISNAPNVYSQALLVEDFNHDNKLDIAMDGIWVMLGKGDGTFQDPIETPASGTPMVVVDINGDGEPDLAALRAPGSVAVLLGKGDGSFMDAQAVALASTPYSYAPAVTAADFNGDGKFDLAAAEDNYPNAQISVELGKGNGTFGKPIISSLTSTATSPTVMLAADFNGDGKTDLLVVDDNGMGFQVLLGRANGRFAPPVDTPLTYSIFFITAGDFNKDGKADLAVTVGNSNSFSLNILLGNGNGTFRLGQQYVVYPNSEVTVADVNGDGDPDLIVASNTYYGPYNLLVFPGNGDGTFKNPLFGPSDYFSSRPVVGDFNHDGTPDVVVATSSGIAFLAGNGDGTFQQQVYSNPGIQFSDPLVVSDFSGQGKLDLASRGGYYYYGNVIMRGNGDGTFGPPTEYDSTSNGQTGGIAAADFNSDGVGDLAIPGQAGNSNAPVIFLYLSTPTPNLRPTVLVFGAVQVGKTSPAKEVTLSNTGNSKLIISSITASGDFLQQNNCGTGLNAGKSCTIQVSFKPQAKGIRKGDVSIVDNAPGKTQNVHLQGTGK